TDARREVPEGLRSRTDPGADQPDGRHHRGVTDARSRRDAGSAHEDEHEYEYDTNREEQHMTAIASRAAASAVPRPPRLSAHVGTLARIVAHTVIVFATVFLFATFITFALQGLSGLSPAHLQLGESATP